MCGIVGALSFTTSAFRISHDYLRRMLSRLEHRGPDGSGSWVSNDRHIGLAHRRLSIIDLSQAASQPMCNRDGTMWISFNGEIYNYEDLRRELQLAGDHYWKTAHSDTEVILHAFEQWGIECLHRFRGMFAFALWDARCRELWLVRDRIGIKPLYYSIHHGRIAFASEIKALLEDPEQQREVNEEALYHFLSFLTSPAPQTLFAGIRKLPAGTWMRVRENGDITQSRYWDVWDHTTPLIDVSDDEIAERLGQELREAVTLHKVSDVPAGIFLSGGVDSSVNTALFSKGESQPVRCFNIGYDREYRSNPNEGRYARRMADWVGAQYHERLLAEQDLLDFLPRMVELQDEPIADPVCVPLYYVSKLARDHGVVVCQVGEGSDELFWGYPSWKIKLQLQSCGDLPLPPGLKRACMGTLSLIGRGDQFESEFLRRNLKHLPVFWGGAEGFTNPQKQCLLSSRLRKRFSGFSSWSVLQPIRQRFEDKAWEPSTLHWMTYLDLNLRLPELLLMRVDKMSMGVGLEARVPFLDHKLVEFVLSIPQAVKTRGGGLKYILKKAARGLVPEEVIDRPKQGFGVPIREWFTGRLGGWVRNELEEFCIQTDLLDWAAVRAVLGNRDKRPGWYLLNLALWWERYIACKDGSTGASAPLAGSGAA